MVVQIREPQLSLLDTITGGNAHCENVAFI